MMTPRALKIVSMSLAAGALATACSITIPGNPYDEGDIEFDPDRPEVGDDETPIDPYTGDNEIVLEAQANLRTGIEFHEKVIWRTCTPNGGVCHNNKEYPDLRTPANFAAAFAGNCNLQPKDHTSVWDGCEQPGDRFSIDGGGFDAFSEEIGWIELIPGEPLEYGDDPPPANAPGLHIHLESPVPGDRESGYGNGQFARYFIESGQVKDIVFTSYNTRWWVIGDRTHLIGDVRNYQTTTVQNLVSVGLVEGDRNRNGIYGARESEPHLLLKPGAPEQSYLIGRMRGEMYDEFIPGSRMPLANQPLSVSEMLALYCLVEQFPVDGDETGMSRAIDYKNCSFTADPESLDLLGVGLSWNSKIKNILGSNCGCHGGSEPLADLDLAGADAYENLISVPSSQRPDLNLIEPGDPANSYLYMKITGAEGIEGESMPIDPLSGEGSLPQDSIDDIYTWIFNGAVLDE